MIISATVLAITSVFGEGGVVGGSPSKDEGVLKKWLDRLADALKRLSGKRFLGPFLGIRYQMMQQMIILSLYRIPS